MSNRSGRLAALSELYVLEVKVRIVHIQTGATPHYGGNDNLYEFIIAQNTLYNEIAYTSLQHIDPAHGSTLSALKVSHPRPYKMGWIGLKFRTTTSLIAHLKSSFAGYARVEILTSPTPTSAHFDFEFLIHFADSSPNTSTWKYRVSDVIIW